ncbi:cupredoxin domain-containing protein [Patescibacteria group bacterium]|nr:cupredoxin domain-containing protein [Patescibacteria group bacterium]
MNLKSFVKSLTRREIILVITIAVLVIVALIFVFVYFGAPKVKPTSTPNSAQTPSQNLSSLIKNNPFLAQTSTQPVTYKSISGPVTVPGANSSQSGNTAVPISVIPAPTNSSVSNRIFNISVSGNAFSPSRIAVYQGDVITINFSAKDKAYDVFQPDYGWKTTIPQGATKLVGFQAYRSGQFTFYCQSCGGPAKGPIGYLIVAPK